MVLIIKRSQWKGLPQVCSENRAVAEATSDVPKRVAWPATATRGTRIVSSPCVGGPQEAPSWQSGDAILAVQVGVEAGFKDHSDDRQTGASVGISRASGPCAG